MHGAIFCYIHLSYLGHISGGSKPVEQRKEMARELSKFLYYTTPEEINFHDVVNIQSIDAFVKELNVRKIGPCGLMLKLNTLCHAHRFLLHR